MDKKLLITGITLASFLGLGTSSYAEEAPAPTPQAGEEQKADQGAKDAEKHCGSKDDKDAHCAAMKDGEGSCGEGSCGGMKGEEKK